MCIHQVENPCCSDSPDAKEAAGSRRALCGATPNFRSQGSSSCGERRPWRRSGYPRKWRQVWGCDVVHDQTIDLVGLWRSCAESNEAAEWGEFVPQLEQIVSDQMHNEIARIRGFVDGSSRDP